MHTCQNAHDAKMHLMPKCTHAKMKNIPKCKTFPNATMPNATLRQVFKHARKVLNKDIYLWANRRKATEGT